MIGFVNGAWASTNSSNQGNPYSLVIMLIIFILIFYFTIFRPQQKRNKNHKRLLNSLSKGDEILTSGGLVGRITKVADSGYILIILNEKNSISNEVLVKRDCIITILPKGTIKSLL